ncbi:MAG: hypothetical protein N2234_08230, partial [Planctomycetota bacterium]|nr:hypothetical protein [Planctomycetota bacterium]
MDENEHLLDEKLLIMYSSLGTNVCAQNILTAAKEFFCPDSGSLMLYERKRRCLSIASSYNLPGEVCSLRIRLGEGVSGLSLIHI